jgi:type II secretion system protein J
MSSRRTQPRAFTLLELLVATAMTAVLAGSLYATLHVAFKARRSALESVDRARRGELAIELLRADIESAVVPKGILAGGFLGEDATEGAGRASDVLMLHCTADGAQAEEGAGDIRMVELACESDEDGEGMVLLRRVTLNLLATTVQEPTEEVVCRGVRSFNLRYFDGVDWQDAWNSAEHDNTLPRAVEATLELLGAGETGTDEAGRLICRVFRIPCSSLSAGLQVETGPR